MIQFKLKYNNRLNEYTLSVFKNKKEIKEELYCSDEMSEIDEQMKYLKEKYKD